MVVDMPPGLWSAVRLSNNGSGQQTQPGTNTCVEADGACCDTVVGDELGEYVIDAVTIGNEDTRMPWNNGGELNLPSAEVTRGAGYSVQLRSGECQVVTSTDDPEAFAGEDGEQRTVERGNLGLCAGCIRAHSCEELLDAP